VSLEARASLRQQVAVTVVERDRDCCPPVLWKRAVHDVGERDDCSVAREILHLLLEHVCRHEEVVRVVSGSAGADRVVGDDRPCLGRPPPSSRWPTRLGPLGPSHELLQRPHVLRRDEVGREREQHGIRQERDDERLRVARSREEQDRCHPERRTRWDRDNLPHTWGLVDSYEKAGQEDRPEDLRAERRPRRPLVAVEGDCDGVRGDVDDERCARDPRDLLAVAERDRAQPAQHLDSVEERSGGQDGDDGGGGLVLRRKERDHDPLGCERSSHRDRQVEGEHRRGGQLDDARRLSPLPRQRDPREGDVAQRPGDEEQ
jgi:hypothetical protein